MFIIICIKFQSKRSTVNNKSDCPGTTGTKSWAEKMDLLSRILFPIFFLVSLVIYCNVCYSFYNYIPDENKSLSGMDSTFQENDPERRHQLTFALRSIFGL